MKRRFVPPLAVGGASAAGLGGSKPGTGMHRPFKLPALVKPAAAAAPQPKVSEQTECSAEQQAGQVPLRLPLVGADHPPLPAPPKVRLPGLRGKKRPAADAAAEAAPAAAADERGAPTLAAGPPAACSSAPVPAPTDSPADGAAGEAAVHESVDPQQQPDAVPAEGAAGAASWEAVVADVPAPPPQQEQQQETGDGPPAPAPAPAPKALEGWRVQRLPAVLPDALPPPRPAAAPLPASTQLLAHLPRLPAAADALVPLGDPSLGDLSAAAQQLEAAAVPQAMATGAEAWGRVAGAEAPGQQMLLALLAAHPLPPAAACSRREAPPQKLLVAGNALQASAPTVRPPAAAQPRARVLAPAGGAPPGAVARQQPRPAAVPAAVPARPAAVSAAPGVKQQPPQQQPQQPQQQQHWSYATPQPLDEARVRRELGERQQVPLSYLRSLIYA